ncbi:peptidase, partial [Streptomyces sp. UNOC14_S4]|nr:peptidase [Streptomyces sp. UNOC14_S4]
PMRERVQLIEALPDDGRGEQVPGRPAMALLHDPDRVCAELEAATFAPEALAMRRADWPELVHVGLHAYATEAAEPLRHAIARVTGGEPGLRAFLEAVDADANALERVADLLPGGRDALRQGLEHLLVLELADARFAWWELSWSGPARLRLPEGYEEAIPGAVQSLLEVRGLSGTVALRSLLPTASATVA